MMEGRFTEIGSVWDSGDNVAASNVACLCLLMALALDADGEWPLFHRISILLPLNSGYVLPGVTKGSKRSIWG
jgi:hypothetical protein